MKTHIIYVCIFRSYKSNHAHGLALISTLQPVVDVAFTDWRLKKLWTSASPLTLSHLYPILSSAAYKPEWYVGLLGRWKLGFDQDSLAWQVLPKPRIRTNQAKSLICIGDPPQCLISHSRFSSNSPSYMIPIQKSKGEKISEEPGQLRHPLHVIWEYIPFSSNPHHSRIDLPHPQPWLCWVG